MKKYGLLVLLLTTQILLSITISSILSHKDPRTRHIAGNFEEGVLKNSSIAMDETLLFDEKWEEETKRQIAKWQDLDNEIGREGNIIGYVDYAQIRSNFNNSIPFSIHISKCSFIEDSACALTVDYIEDSKGRDTESRVILIDCDTDVFLMKHTAYDYYIQEKYCRDDAFLLIKLFKYSEISGLFIFGGLLAIDILIYLLVRKAEKKALSLILYNFVMLLILIVGIIRFANLFP